MPLNPAGGESPLRCPAQLAMRSRLPHRRAPAEAARVVLRSTQLSRRSRDECFARIFFFLSSFPRLQYFTRKRIFPEPHSYKYFGRQFDSRSKAWPRTIPRFNKNAKNIARIRKNIAVLSIRQGRCGCATDNRLICPGRNICRRLKDTRNPGHLAQEFAFFTKREKG